MSDAGPDSWFSPGRPEHPDFLIIADLLLAADATSNEQGMEAYIAAHSPTPMSDLSKVALDEAQHLAKTYPQIPVEALFEAAWTMGFAAGVRVSRGEPQPTPEDMKRDPLATAYAGADPETIRYVARQRSQRIPGTDATRADQRVIILAGAWLDAVMVGFRYDARRRDVT